MTGALRRLSGYRDRVVDTELDELLTVLPAVSLEGPKGVGKTSTAERRVNTIIRLDDPGTFEIIGAHPSRLTVGTTPVLIDEWQRYPQSWDIVRRAVDADPSPARFILTATELGGSDSITVNGRFHTRAAN